MKVTCEKCGHLNETPALEILEVPDWRSALDPFLAATLETGFKKVVGDLQPPARPGESPANLYTDPTALPVKTRTRYMTLFLSTVVRRPLIDFLNAKDNPGSLSEDIQWAYREQIVPALEKVHANFKVLGTLAKPSWLKMAVTNLNQSAVVFCFPTVEFEEQYQSKLDALGLGNIGKEGVMASGRGTL